MMIDRKRHQSQSDVRRKNMLTIRWDFKCRDFHVQTINLEEYCEHLNNLNEPIIQKYSDIVNRKEVVFHYDNVGLHISSSNHRSLHGAWSKTITIAIGRLSLAELYHMYAGSFLHQSAQAGALSVGCVFSLLLLKILLSAITAMSDGLIVHHTKAHTFRTYYNVTKDTVAVFVTIPQGLSYLSLPQLWTFFYFGCNITISMCNQVLHLISMQIAITDMYPNFYKFRVYVFGVICISSAFIGLCMLPECIFAILQLVFNDVMPYIKCVNVLVLSIMIFWVYGVTNLSDDIHFLMGSQPTKYWKICWYLCPLVVILTLVYTTLKALGRTRTYLIVATAGCLTLLSPTVVFVVIVLLGYIKQRNLLGTIRPTELWGPPDSDDRALRRMFNPRLETKCQAHKMVCDHFCLFGNKDLQNIIVQENVSRREYLVNLMETKGINIFISEDF